MDNTLGGNVVIRNGIELDYCWKEAVQSLLPVCDTVTICDGESTDGTQEEVRAWAAKEPKISVCVWPWPNPVGNPEWFEDFINYAREHVKADLQFQLDADEIVHEDSYQEILRLKRLGDKSRCAAWCHRLTFWADAKHLVPSGVMLADRVVRIAPQFAYLPSDGCNSKPNIPSGYAVDTGIKIFHYGFLRKRDAMFKKERLLQNAFFGSYDKRLEAAEKFHGNWALMPGINGWEDRLTPFKGTHPAVAKAWLKERGYDT